MGKGQKSIELADFSTEVIDGIGGGDVKGYSIAGYKAPACGDSNTIGFSGIGSSFPVYLQEQTGFTIPNLGVGGKKSDEILAEQIPRAIELSHKYIIVMPGTNDTPGGYTVAQTSANIEAICMEIINSGRIPIIIHILPGAAGAYKTERDAINFNTSNFSSAKQALVVTVEEFDDGSGGLKTEYNVGIDDGVHLNIAGLQELATQIFAQTGIDIDTETSIQKGSSFGIMAPSNNFVSDDFSTWATQENLDTWTTGVTAPDGTLTAYGMVADVTDDVHTVKSPNTTSMAIAGVRYEGVFVKAGLSKYMRVRNDTNGSTVRFNLEDKGGVYQPIGPELDDYGFIALVDGWFFVYIRSATSYLANSDIQIEAYRDRTTGSFAGDGVTPELFLWKPLHSDTMNAQFINYTNIKPDILWERNSNTNLYEHVSDEGTYDDTPYLRNVSTDLTLTGAGVPSDPLVVVGGNCTSIQGVHVSGEIPAGAAIVGTTLQGIEYTNIIIQSQDISQANWAKFAVTVDGVDGIIGTAVPGSHFVHDEQVLAGTNTISFECKSEDKEFGWVTFPTASAYIDIENVAMGTLVNIVNSAIEPMLDGWVRVRLQINETATDNLTLGAAVSTSASSYTGDGSTVDIRYRNIQIDAGTIEDNFPFVATTGAPANGQALKLL